MSTGLPDPTFCPDGEAHQLPEGVHASNGYTACERCGGPARVPEVPEP